MSVDLGVSNGVTARIAGVIPAVSVIALVGGLPAIAAGAPADPQSQTVGAANASTDQLPPQPAPRHCRKWWSPVPPSAGGNAQQALPVQILNAADIARTGAVSVPELMQQVSAVDSVGSTQPAQGTGYTTGGIATVSLHGLGSDRTLVLINGLRSTLYGGTSVDDSVDIGAIPVAAIQNVQILKDGASAVYGSDAIAGVVNFILKQDFQGLDASATVGTPTQAGGGTQETVSIYGGHRLARERPLQHRYRPHVQSLVAPHG